MIAMERMANNNVYVFKKRQPSKFSVVAEVRSHVEKAAKPPSAMYVGMYNKEEKGREVIRKKSSYFNLFFGGIHLVE